MDVEYNGDGQGWDRQATFAPSSMESMEEELVERWLSWSVRRDRKAVQLGLRDAVRACKSISKDGKKATMR